MIRFSSVIVIFIYYCNYREYQVLVFLSSAYYDFLKEDKDFNIFILSFLRFSNFFSLQLHIHGQRQPQKIQGPVQRERYLVLNTNIFLSLNLEKYNMASAMHTEVTVLLFCATSVLENRQTVCEKLECSQGVQQTVSLRLFCFLSVHTCFCFTNFIVTMWPLVRKTKLWHYLHLA